LATKVSRRYTKTRIAISAVSHRRTNGGSQRGHPVRSKPPILCLPSAQARRAKLRNIGYGVPSDFELNFGRYLPALGQADGDDVETQPNRSSP
jgi:hypothetical protein